MENNARILYPVFALAAWTFIVLLEVLRARIASRLRPEEFRYGESKAVSDKTAIPNRAYMNLLELPVLFYVACLLLFVSGHSQPPAPAVAWTYVGLRVAHSLIHLTYNNVIHRMTAFLLSNITLVALW